MVPSKRISKSRVPNNEGRKTQVSNSPVPFQWCWRGDKQGGGQGTATRMPCSKRGRTIGLMENWTTGFYVIDEWKEIGVGEKRDRLLVIGYWLSVIGYRLLVIGYQLSVILLCYWIPASGPARQAFAGMTNTLNPLSFTRMRGTRNLPGLTPALHKIHITKFTDVIDLVAPSGSMLDPGC